MDSDTIRKKFLEFFEKKGHRIVSSDLLVPRKDPTLLFTGAGMNQFKEQFMGNNITYKRAVSSQKCLRTGDIENVGRTPRHHTFFEMLGNFSFGDYFKKEAILWGWEFMTGELAIPEERLWISVYEEDDESYNIWSRDIGLNEDRIVKLGAKDNFWPSDAPSKGPNGPCGPCSEIFYDWGHDTGCGKDGCDPECDCGRFVEVWNLVFTEFERKPDGELVPLPNKNIDTGMGLERITSVIQNVHSNFETDLFVPLIEQIKKVLGDTFDQIDSSDVNLIADHIRAITFSIGDGVSPSNENRGYVIRKLIRRAFLRNPDKKPYLFALVPKVTSMLKKVYPDTEEKREHISAIVKEEEEKFNNTLISTMPIFDNMTEESSGKLPGDKIFKLVDTYGLPVDVIEETARERKIELDMEGFEGLMRQRKEQSRKTSDIASDFIFQPDLFDQAPRPDFSDILPLETRIKFILKNELPGEVIVEGEDAEIILDPQSSSFYAESGGQAGDTGTVSGEASLMKVLNTYETGGRKVLYVRGLKGKVKLNDKVVLALDDEKKHNTAKNHTATHLLQAALRDVLGEHIKQSGSSVDEKRLRFDFTHLKKVSERELEKIEGMVNEWISSGINVCREEKKLEEAKKEGALSFFGEKYDDTVRVITVGDKSKELCGGTHVENTSEIDVFKIISESSVASGVRRIEAVTGASAKKWVKDKAEELFEGLRETTDVPEKYLQPEVLELCKDIADGKVKIDRKIIKQFDKEIKPLFMGAIENIKKEVKKKKKLQVQDRYKETLNSLIEKFKSSENIGGVGFYYHVLDDVDMGLMRKVAKSLESKVSPGVLFLGGRKEGKAFLICIVMGEQVRSLVSAKDIINKAAGRIGGKGGGKDDFAQAGGSNADGLEDAVNVAKEFIKNKV